MLAEEITTASVQRVATAAALHVTECGARPRGVLVAHDARFLSARLARVAADAVAAAGVPVCLPSGPVPAPVAAFAVSSGRHALGLLITGGAAPPEIVGLTLLGPSG